MEETVIDCDEKAKSRGLALRCVKREWCASVCYGTHAQAGRGECTMLTDAFLGSRWASDLQSFGMAVHPFSGSGGSSLE